MSKSPRPRPKPGRELSPPARKVLKSYFITDRRRLAKGDLVSVVSRAMDVGVDLVQVREKDLPGKELEELARHLVRRARRHPSVKILVNDRLDV
ncbi:MAG: thiamine phosphate synthase, partial [Acidobacteriota bacterium]